MVALENGNSSAAERQMANLSVANGPSNGAIVAVGEVQSSLPKPDLAGVKAVESHTKALGIIHPPPDIRAIVDKTAAFVAKNGLSFEPRILAENATNVKFNFLRPTDPYHAYYRFRVTESQKEEAGEGRAGPSEAEKAAAQKAADVAAAQAVAVTATGATKILEAPQPEHYTVHVPEGLTLMDLDVIRLVAQFVARNGKNFLTGLAGREHANPIFNFIKPTHSLFGFFTGLCDAYSRVLMPEKGLQEKLQKDLDDRMVILERCLRRLEWEKVKEKENKEAADQLEAERMAMQSIDWHDFVVVETIDFYDDEDAELGPPVTQRDVLLLNKTHPEEEEDLDAVKAAEEAVAELDEEEKALLAEAEERGAAVPPPSRPAPAAAAAETAPEPEEEDMDMEDDEDQREIRVVKNYQRPDLTAGVVDASKFVKSPITGELIRLEDMAEHMRISLIDPRFQEQRAAMMSKMRGTTKASDDEIGSNLLRLAGQRPDVFGSTDQEVEQIVKSTLLERDMSGSQRQPAWDGVTTSGAAMDGLRAELNGKRKDMEKPTPQPILGPAPGISLQPPPVRPGPPVAFPPPPPRPVAAPLAPDKQAEASRLQALASQHIAQRMQQQAAIQQVMQTIRPIPPPIPFRPPMLSQPIAPPPLPPPPAIPPPPMPPMPEGEPDPKRQRIEFVLQPEDEFLAAHPGASKVSIQCPEADDNPQLHGQLLQVELASLTDTVGELKARIQDTIKLAPNKQRLAREGVGFMRDELSLAHYNVDADTTLTLSLRTRGR